MPGNLIGNLEGLGGAVGGIGKTVIDIGKGIKTLITGKLDPEAENAIEMGWAQVEQATMAQQNRINELEAQSSSTWVSGWRPAIGWSAAISLWCYYVPRFILGTTLWAIQVIKTGVFVMPPDLGISDLLGLVVPMLGIAGMRTVEKIKGAQGRH